MARAPILTCRLARKIENKEFIRPFGHGLSSPGAMGIFTWIGLFYAPFIEYRCAEKRNQGGKEENPIARSLGSSIGRHISATAGQGNAA